MLVIVVVIVIVIVVVVVIIGDCASTRARDIHNVK